MKSRPVPADLDLTNLSYMPLHVRRLLGSDTWMIASGDEAKAAVTLWARAWQQVPAGSLPNDDRLLAALSGAGSKWRKVKGVALRGFEICDADGRLYHAVICEEAMEAHEKRERWRTKKRRQRGQDGDVPDPVSGDDAGDNGGDAPNDNSTNIGAMRATNESADDVIINRPNIDGSEHNSPTSKSKVCVNNDLVPPVPGDVGRDKHGDMGRDNRGEMPLRDGTGRDISKNPTPPPIPTAARTKPGSESVRWGVAVKAKLAERWPDHVSIAMMSTGLCAAWIADGFDLEADVLATVEALAADKNDGPPTSLKYFSEAIRRRHRDRTSSAAAESDDAGVNRKLWGKNLEWLVGGRWNEIVMGRKPDIRGPCPKGCPPDLWTAAQARTAA